MADHQRPRTNKRKRKRRWEACDCVDCGSPCDLFLIGRLLAWFALTTPDRRPLPQSSGPGRAGMLLIGGYRRWLTRLLPTSCRHMPSCSAYGLAAVRRYGLVTGSRLTLGRIRRCTSSTPRGTIDPVP